MPIYQKGTNFTKVKDIYLCTGASDFTRICKVYLCTAANTFQLVYDGCTVTCDCETFCTEDCAEFGFFCARHLTQKQHGKNGLSCNCGGECDDATPSEKCYPDDVVFETGACYVQNIPCSGIGSHVCYYPCCAGTPKNCPDWEFVGDGGSCCGLQCP